MAQLCDTYCIADRWRRHRGTCHHQQHAIAQLEQKHQSHQAHLVWQLADTQEREKSQKTK